VDFFITSVDFLFTHVDEKSTHVDFFSTHVDFFAASLATHLLHFLGLLSILSNANGRPSTLVGRVEGVSIYKVLFEFEGMVVISWYCEVLWGVVVLWYF
jgi:hypothetical protein